MLNLLRAIVRALLAFPWDTAPRHVPMMQPTDDWQFDYLAHLRRLDRHPRDRCPAIRCHRARRIQPTDR